MPAVQGVHFLGGDRERGSSASGSQSLSDLHGHAQGVPKTIVCEPLADPPGNLEAVDTGYKQEVALKHIPRPSSVPIDMAPYKIVATQAQAYEFVESQMSDLGSELR